MTAGAVKLCAQPLCGAGFSQLGGEPDDCFARRLVCARCAGKSLKLARDAVRRRPPVTDDGVAQRIHDLYVGGHSVHDIARAIGMAPGPITALVKHLGLPDKFKRISAGALRAVAAVDAGGSVNSSANRCGVRPQVVQAALAFRASGGTLVAWAADQTQEAAQ